MQEVEERNDNETGEPADEPTAQRDDLLVFEVVRLERLEVVRAEVELERHRDVLPGLELAAHVGGAGHEVMALVVLGHEGDRELAGIELLRGPHDGREELLLEGEPRKLGVDAAAGVAAAADLLGLLVAVEVVVDLGVLRLVAVALLHTGNGNGEVKVEGRDVTRNDALHVHHRQEVVHGIRVLVKDVLLLDVASAGERKAHHDRRIGLFRNREYEVGGVDVFARVQAHGIIACLRLDDVEVLLLVSLVLLYHHGIGLGALGREGNRKLVVLQREELSAGIMRQLQERVLVNGGLDGHGGRVLKGGKRRGGVERSTLESLRAGDGIQLGLVRFLFGNLAALVPEEPHHDEENQDKANN